MPRNRNTLAVAVAAAALAGGGAGAAAVALSHTSSPQAAPAAAPVASTAANVAATSALSLEQIAKQSTPSVVEIDATSAAPQSQNQFGGGGGGGGTQSAEGTGFVYDNDGHIVTNEHVIDGASSVSVKLSDGSTWKATVVGSRHLDRPRSPEDQRAHHEAHSTCVRRFERRRRR